MSGVLMVRSWQTLTKGRSLYYAGSTILKLARLPARSCSAVKACPQVLHLHVELGLRFSAPELSRGPPLG